LLSLSYQGNYYGTRKHTAEQGDLIRCTSLAKRSSEQELARARLINVTRGANGFGFNIIDVDFPTGGQGIFVSQVDPDGPATDDEGLREGMQIMAINGQDVSKTTREVAAQALRETGNFITLLVRSNLQVYAAFRHRLLKESRDQASNIEV